MQINPSLLTKATSIIRVPTSKGTGFSWVHYHMHLGKSIKAGLQPSGTTNYERTKSDKLIKQRRQEESESDDSDDNKQQDHVLENFVNNNDQHDNDQHGNGQHGNGQHVNVQRGNQHGNQRGGNRGRNDHDSDMSTSDDDDIDSDDDSDERPQEIQRQHAHIHNNVDIAIDAPGDHLDKFWKVIQLLNWTNASDGVVEPETVTGVINGMSRQQRQIIAQNYPMLLEQGMTLMESKIKNLVPNATDEVKKIIVSHIIGLGADWYNSCCGGSDIIEFVIQCNEYQDLDKYINAGVLH